jgi:hypothetical protein
MIMVTIPIGRMLFVNSFMQFAQDHECIITSYFAYRKSIETQEPRQGEEFSAGNDVSSLRYVNEYLFLQISLLLTFDLLICSEFITDSTVVVL